MKITIFGATGKTGKLLVSQALERGYEVTAFTRSPDKLTQTAPKLAVVVGTRRIPKRPQTLWPERTRCSARSAPPRTSPTTR